MFYWLVCLVVIQMVFTGQYEREREKVLGKSVYYYILNCLLVHFKMNIFQPLNINMPLRDSININYYYYYYKALN